MKNKYIKIAGIALTAILIGGLSWAAFSDKGTVLGSAFSVGHSDLKLMEVLSGTTDAANLKDFLTGPSFTNITPNWQQDYLVKIFNGGSTPLQLASSADYQTANDPDELRSYIFVEPIEWVDANGSGTVDEGESGASLGRKSIVKWKTEGFSAQYIWFLFTTRYLYPATQ